MDNRLVLTVLFVTLSWMSGTTNSTTTSTAPNSTTTNSMTSNNMTTAPNSMTTNNMTTVPNSMTTNNMTTAPATATATATAVATTTNTTLITNTTVIVLETPVNRTGCGIQQLCGSEPSDCDPSQSSSSCFFVSAKQTNGQNFEFSMSGESSGYVASTVSADATVGDNDRTYICANKNGKVKFFSALLDNDKLTLTELPVNSVKGRVSGNLIQCTFVATLDLSTTRAAASTSNAALSFSTGTFDSDTESFGDPNTRFQSGVVDLSDANATVSNVLPNTATTTTTTTTTTTATAHATTFQQSLMQVLLISVGIFTMATV